MTIHSLNKFVLGLAMVLLGAYSHADTAVISETSSAFPYKTGEDVFKHVCAACHMPDAKGAVGAGYFPALAKNPKLTAAGYIGFVVVNGQKGMPPFGGTLTDTQIADTINYVRTHFGNNFADKVSAQDIGKLRQPGRSYQLE